MRKKSIKKLNIQGHISKDTGRSENLDPAAYSKNSIIILQNKGGLWYSSVAKCLG